MTGKALIGFTAAALVALGIASSSRAAPITWAFEGTVRSFMAADPDAADLAGSLGVAVDAPVSGRVVYESTTPDAFPPDGTYLGAIIGFDVTIGSYAVALDLAAGFNTFDIRLLQQDLDVDLEFAQGIGARDALFPAGAILTLSLLADLVGVIPDTALPIDPPPLSSLRPFATADWDDIGFGTGLDILGNGTRALIELSRLERVPEPGLASLLAPGLLAVAALRLRAW